MRITQLKLHTFRNVPSANINVGDASLVCLYGPNGMGKTNLLEAISLLSPGRGLHKDKREEQTMEGEKSWGIHATLDMSDGEHTIGMEYRNGQGSRKIKVDENTSSSQSELAKLGNVLWFTPKMDRLFLDSAQPRRDFYDRLTYGLFPDYAATLARYKHHLKSRLKLLKDNADKDWIAVEEQQVATYGLEVLTQRQAYLEKLQPHLPEVALELTGSANKYLESDDSYLEYLGKLADIRDRDAIVGSSTFGPHRSDIDGLLKLDTDKTVKLSRTSTGQHKRALLYILLAHARLMRTEKGDAPIILLDEMTSHLDEQMRQHFFETLHALDAQIWMTGTEKNLFNNLPEQNMLFVNVSNGEFTPEG